jgi:hypothetical protein
MVNKRVLQELAVFGGSPLSCAVFVDTFENMGN